MSTSVHRRLRAARHCSAPRALLRTAAGLSSAAAPVGQCGATHKLRSPVRGGASLSPRLALREASGRLPCGGFKSASLKVWAASKPHVRPFHSGGLISLMQHALAHVLCIFCTRVGLRVPPYIPHTFYMLAPFYMLARNANCRVCTIAPFRLLPTLFGQQTRNTRKHHAICRMASLHIEACLSYHLSPQARRKLPPYFAARARVGAGGTFLAPWEPPPPSQPQPNPPPVHNCLINPLPQEMMMLHIHKTLFLSSLCFQGDWVSGGCFFAQRLDLFSAHPAFARPRRGVRRPSAAARCARAGADREGDGPVDRAGGGSVGGGRVVIYNRRFQCTDGQSAKVGCVWDVKCVGGRMRGVQKQQRPARAATA